MSRKSFQYSKGRNPALQEIKIETKISRLMATSKENTKQYIAIIYTAIIAALLKADNRMSDREIQDIVTNAKKILLENTEEFDPINEVVRAVLKKTDINLSIDELIAVYPEISGYILPDKDL